MMTEIKQRNFFITRKATILENKVEYESNHFGRRLGATVNFEDLTNIKNPYIQHNMAALVALVSCMTIALTCFGYRNDPDMGEGAWIFWGIGSLVAGVAYYSTVERLWKVKVANNTYLFFFRNLPNKETADDFLETLFARRNIYLRETYYSAPTKFESYEAQKHNFQWLRRNDIITKEEFEDSVKKLGEIFNIESRKVGF